MRISPEALSNQLTNRLGVVVAATGSPTNDSITIRVGLLVGYVSPLADGRFSVRLPQVGRDPFIVYDIDEMARVLRSRL